MIVKEGYFTIILNFGGRLYDVSPDGQRFLVLKPSGVAASPSLILVQHFDEELRRLVPP